MICNCLTCGKELVELRTPDSLMVFLECPNCRIIWDYFYKDGRKKTGDTTSNISSKANK